jgi:tetratricopeptide (TPR) repeat protein
MVDRPAQKEETNLADQAAPPKRKWRRIVWIVLPVLLCVCAGILAFLKLHARDVRYYSRGELYLESGDSVEALLEFRAAVALNPQFLEARTGIVRALIARKEFSQALSEVDQAVGNGLAESEAARLKARVYFARADQRLAAAGEMLTVAICENAIAADVDPAIELVTQCADKAKDPSDAYSQLGDIYAQKSRIAVREWEILVKEYDRTRELQRNEEATAKEAEILALLPKVRSVQNGAVAAYSEAVRRDPNAVHPRVGIARYAIEAYLPRPQQAREILQPLMSHKPAPADALELMAIAEWYAGDYNRAIEHVNALLEQNVDSLPDLLLKADILIDAERWSEAAEVGRTLMALDPQGGKSGLDMGRILLHDDQPNEAVNLLQNVFTDPKMKWPQARLVLAEALMRVGNVQQAVKNYRKTIEDLDGVFATNARQQSELVEARYKSCLALGGAEKEVGQRTALDNAVKAFGLFPDRPEAFHLARDQYQAAGLGLEKIEDLVLLHAEAMIARGQSDQALKFLQGEYVAFKVAPGKGTRIRLFIARLLAQNGSTSEAVAIYEDLRKAYPNTALYAYELARLYTQLKQDQQAKAVYESVLASKPDDMNAVSGLVEVLIRTKDLSGVSAILDRVSGRAGSEQVWGVVLDSYVHEGQLDQAVALAKSYVERSPSNPVAQVALAELLWKRGDLEGARSAYDAALNLAPDFPPAQRRAYLDLQQNRPSDAVTLLRKVVEKVRTDDMQTFLAVALQADGKVQEAGDILKEISTSAQGPSSLLDLPRWYYAVLRAGETDLQTADAFSDLLAKGDFGTPEERRDLLQSVAAAPEAVRREAAARLNLLMFLTTLAFPDPALQQADLVRKLLPDEPLAACWQAQLLDTSGNYEAAAEEYRQIIAAHPKFLRAKLFLAQSYQRNHQIEKAVQVLEDSLTVAKPDDAAMIQLSLGKIYEDQGRLEPAIASYQAAMTQDSVKAPALNNLAMLYALRRNDLESAMPLAEQAEKLDPREPAIQDTRGWILYLKGKYEDAVPKLAKAKTGLPDVPTVRYHLGKALLKVGRRDEARAELEQALAISKDFPEAADAALVLQGL